MSLSDRLTELTQPTAQPYVPARSVRQQHPQGWEPSITFDGTSGTLSTGPLAERPTQWDDVLRVWDLDPELFEVVEPVQFRAWDAQVGGGETRRLFYYRATVRRRVPLGVDLDELVREIKRYRPSKRPKVVEVEGAMVVLLADWQIGCSDGDGLRGTVQRVTALISLLEQRAAELRKVGRRIDALYVLCLGDLVEGCSGHYEMQTFSVEADRRDQVKIARKLLVKLLTAWAKSFERVVVVAVAGNHGEHRRKGKAFTTFNDNDDVAIVEQVAEVFAANPASFGHVSFVLPRGELSVTVQVGKLVVGLTHGHVAGQGATAEAKLLKWYERQAAAKRPVGDADILVSGHYHHLRVADWGGCVWIQAPSMDGGSQWWEESYGGGSRPGTVTFTLDDDLGVRDLQVLGSAHHRTSATEAEVA